jgi:hypothetical protein
LDKQLQGDRIEIRPFPGQLAEISTNFGNSSASSRFPADVFSSALLSAKPGTVQRLFLQQVVQDAKHASYERSASEPTCTAEHFFHT